MTSETDNKVEAAVEHLRRTVEGGSHLMPEDQVNVPIGVLRALISSKEAADQRCERLAAEVERLTASLNAERSARIEAVETMAAERKFYTAEFNRLKEKLSALVEDARRYRRLRVLGCAVTDTPQLDAGTVVRFTGLDDLLDADLKYTPSRGEFPARAQEVAGLVERDIEWLKGQTVSCVGVRHSYTAPDEAARTEHNARIDRILTALSSSPSQGGETVDRSGVAAADDNHKALAEGVLQVQSDLQMLARACQENDPKAEIAIRISDALDVIQDRIAPLLAAFQSRKEESR